MPSEGDIIKAYGREYIFIAPNATEPGTWRLSVPEDADQGSLGEVIGEDPIVTTKDDKAIPTTTISFDIRTLPNRV